MGLLIGLATIKFYIFFFLTMIILSSLWCSHKNHIASRHTHVVWIGFSAEAKAQIPNDILK